MPDRPEPGQRAVLVVEDEALVRMDIVDALEQAGYLVVEASNADEAIAILERRTDIRLVFTDVHMPGSMDGVKLAHAVSGRWPPIKLMVASGHVRVAPSDLPPGARFFVKPYDPSIVVNTVSRMIGD